MKRKKNLIIMIIFVLCSLMLLSCKIVETTPEKVLSKLEKLNSYESNLDIIYFNEREERKEECKQYYSKDNGYVLKIGERRKYIYKNGNISVEDNVAERKYTINNNFDEVYKYTCIEEVLNLITDNDAEVITKEHEGKKILIANFLLPGINRNLAKGEIIVNMDKPYPEELNIYDLKGEKRINIVFNNFISNGEIDKDIFKE